MVRYDFLVGTYSYVKVEGTPTVHSEIELYRVKQE